MAAIANMSLFDGQATPVVKVFTPTKAALDTAEWADRSSGRYIGLPIVKLQSKVPVKSSPLFKVNFAIDLPTLETITNANANGYTAPPQVAYVTRVVGTVFSHARSGNQERKDICAYASNLLKDPQFVNLVVNFEQPY